MIQRKIYNLHFIKNPSMSDKPTMKKLEKNYFLSITTAEQSFLKGFLLEEVRNLRKLVKYTKKKWICFA